jgi:nitroreductase
MEPRTISSPLTDLREDERLMQVIRGRRSVRKYESTPLPSDAIDKMKTALIWAPSAGNLQSRRFFFVSRPATRALLARAAPDSEFIGNAPLIVVACADRRIERDYLSRGLSLYAIQDVAAAIQNLLLMIHSLELGGCWVGAFNEAAVKAALGLPDFLRPVALVSVGFPAESPEPPPRPEPSSIASDVK